MRVKSWRVKGGDGAEAERGEPRGEGVKSGKMRGANFGRVGN